jgi:hypothetical protein
VVRQVLHEEAGDGAVQVARGTRGGSALPGRPGLVVLEHGPVARWTFEPGRNDASTVGDEACVMVGFGGLQGYAVSS